MFTTILNAISKDRQLPSGGTSSEEPLKVLQREYPNLCDLVEGKRILDFGCGYGEQSRALAKTYRCLVTGYDNNPRVLNEAKKKPEDNVMFVDVLDPTIQYDVVISLNAMEHFPHPEGVLDLMIKVLKPGGLLLITFGCPWYSPYGSHMHFFCAVPWVNLLFPEKAVMKVRERFWKDGATRYEDVEGGLNKMTIAKFERLIEREDLSLVHRQYTGVKRINVFTKVPVVRELMTNHATVILKKK